MTEAVAGVIRRGGVVAIPTDTVYGLACDPADGRAVERIYAVKRRPAGLELTLLAASVDELAGLVRMTPVAAELAGRFWPGPLSIVLPAGERRLAVPRSGTTLSVRVPDHALLLTLLRTTGPLATTSANRHGEPAAVTAADVEDALGADVDAILDGGAAGGEASTIIDCSMQPARVLRDGPVTREELEPHLRR